MCPPHPLLGRERDVHPGAGDQRGVLPGRPEHHVDPGDRRGGAAGELRLPAQRGDHPQPQRDGERGVDAGAWHEP